LYFSISARTRLSNEFLFVPLTLWRRTMIETSRRIQGILEYIRYCVVAAIRLALGIQTSDFYTMAR
jgi:hypothetical protein